MAMITFTRKALSHFPSLSSPAPQCYLLLLRLSSSCSAASSAPFSTSAQGNSYRRQQEDESRSVPVSVWWDFENCPVPAGAKILKVSHFITSAVRGCGIKGPVQITAFGDVRHLPRIHQEGLFDTGINVTHVPGGGKNSADRSLLFDLMFWVSQNPPPAHLFLISGDRDFAGILHRLRMNNYNILLACRETTPAVLCSAASITWYWNVLVRGENIVGKYFNQPPDGPYNSWYGHYKVTLEDPFVSSEPSSSQLANGSSDGETITDSKPPTMPKAVLRKIEHVVNLYPGLRVRDLRKELLENGVNFNNYYYGYKRLSDLLLSMPHICKLRHSRGHFFVHPVSPKAFEPIENSANEKQDSASTFSTSKNMAHSDPSMNDVLPSLPSAVKLNVNDVFDKATNEKPPLPSAQTKDKDVAKSDEGSGSVENLVPVSASIEKNEAGPVPKAADLKLPLSSSDILNENENKGDLIDEVSTGSCVKEDRDMIKEQLKETGSGEVFRNHVDLLDKQESSPEMGLFRRLFNKLVGKMFSQKKSYEVRDDKFGDIDRAERMIKIEGSDGKITDSASCTSSGIEFSNAKSHAEDSHSHLSRNQSGKVLKAIDKSNEDELFLMDSFWNDVQSFLRTKEGSRIILNSLTREEIVQNLKKIRPLVTRSLEENDLHHLVDLMISEKKLIEVCPSTKPPFRLVQPAASSSNSASAENTNQLSNNSSGLSSQSNSDPFPDQESKDRSENNSCSVLPSNSTKNKKPCEKSRNEIYADCKNLMNELLKESPKGVDVGYFRLQFIKRYGYILDYKKLGFKDLTSLLQTISAPGCVLPATTKSSEDIDADRLFKQRDKQANSGSSIQLLKEEEDEDAWAELGPVENLNSVLGKDENSSLNTLDRKYGSRLSQDDDDLSDSTEDVSCSSFSLTEDVNRKPRKDGDNSSFVRLLNAWEEGKKAKNDGITSSGQTGYDYENSMVRGSTRKYRPSKSYSFVKDSDDSVKVIDDILDNYKKCESRMLS